MDDKQIVKLYFERNEEGIRQTSLKYGVRLRKIANGILKNYEEAEECENDTYLQAWNLIPPNDPSEYFVPVLAKCIRQMCFVIWKKKQSKERYVQYV